MLRNFKNTLHKRHKACFKISIFQNLNVETLNSIPNKCKGKRPRFVTDRHQTREYLIGKK